MATATSEIIPRERLSPWQRWELASLPHGDAPAVPPAAAPLAPVAPEQDAAMAFARGFEEGRAAGHAEGRVRAEAERAQLAKLLASLGATLAEREQVLVDDVLDLALALARQMAGEALAVRRELLLPIVGTALRQLPQGSQRVEILVNPADVELVRDHLHGQSMEAVCHVAGNAAIAPGGCRVETEQCEVDATAQSRWKRLAAALGRTDEWLLRA